MVVHEFVHHAVSPEATAAQLFNSRSKLWRVLVPPDQLNPDGFVDARLDNFSPLEVRCCCGIWTKWWFLVRPCHHVPPAACRMTILHSARAGKQTGRSQNCIHPNF